MELSYVWRGSEQGDWQDSLVAMLVAGCWNGPLVERVSLTAGSGAFEKAAWAATTSFLQLLALNIEGS